MVLLCMTLGGLNLIVLTIISAFHFYWALGGSFGFSKTIPTNKEGKRMLNPKKIDCTVVAIFLLLFATLFFIKAGSFKTNLPTWVAGYGVWAISAIFFLRAVGDFRYVGFTKKITSTEFARLDTKYYSPLCLFLGLNGIVLEMLLKAFPKI